MHRRKSIKNQKRKFVYLFFNLNKLKLGFFLALMDCLSDDDDDDDDYYPNINRYDCNRFKIHILRKQKVITIKKQNNNSGFQLF